MSFELRLFLLSKVQPPRDTRAAALRHASLPIYLGQQQRREFSFCCGKPLLGWRHGRRQRDSEPPVRYNLSLDPPLLPTPRLPRSRLEQTVQVTDTQRLIFFSHTHSTSPHKHLPLCFSQQASFPSFSILSLSLSFSICRSLPLTRALRANHRSRLPACKNPPPRLSISIYLSIYIARAHDFFLFLSFYLCLTLHFSPSSLL